MLTQISSKNFAAQLASKKPVPGGGGAAALASAFGVALNTMVANFSLGKKQFADKVEQHEDLIKKGTHLREKLMFLVDKDAECFEPLSRAYTMPSFTAEEKRKKHETMQECLKNACSAPMEVLMGAYEGIMLHREILDISSKNIVSDVGVGVQMLKAGMNSAYLNVLINLNSISDEKFVIEQKKKAEALLFNGIKIADEVYGEVVNILTS